MIFTTPGTVSITNNTWSDITADANSISYYTPRVSGFQLGVSYTPDGMKTPNGPSKRQRADFTHQNYSGKLRHQI